MKAIRIINNIFMGISISLGFLGFIDNEVWILAALSAIPLGLVQVILSIIVGAKYKLKTTLSVYFILTALYFICSYIFGAGMNLYFGRMEELFIVLAIGTPIFLAFFFTILIYVSYKNINSPEEIRTNKINDLNVLDQF